MSSKSKLKSFSIGKNLQNGLESTFDTVKEYSGDLNIQAINVQDIELDPNNPRKLSVDINDIQSGLEKNDPLYKEKAKEIHDLTLLANTIKHQGLINPILVFKHNSKFRLIAGERRTLATLINGSKYIHAKILDAKPTDLKIGLLQWIENIQREDLTLWERMLNIEKIIESYLLSNNTIIEELTVEKLSDLIGISKSQAHSYKSIIKASNKIKSLVENGKITNLEKAVFIENSPVEFQEIIIDSAIKGYSLKQLKDLQNELKASKAPPKALGERGRKATKFNLGTTTDLKTAKRIMETLLASESLSLHSSKFDDIHWEDINAVNKAFKEILSILENTKD